MRIALAIALCLGPAALTGQTVSGIFDDQVFQRDEQGRAEIRVSGAAPAAARAVEARVLRQFLPIEGLDWAKFAEVRAGKWEGSLRGVPAGGPYRVEFRWVDGGGKAVAEAARSGILVGDLWILAGQSNMEGVANLVDVEAPNGLVHMFDMSDEWRLAEEPLHSLRDAVDSFHWRGKVRLTGAEAVAYRRSRIKGAGLGLPFAVNMLRYTGVPVGLVPCAHGGTSMEQWSPALRDQGGASLYGAMLRRQKAVGGRVKGVLWYQGESDASPKAAPQFTERVQALVQAIRSDFGQPELPFYYVQINRVIRAPGSDASAWNSIQDQERRQETEIANVAMVSGIDLALDDGIHIGTQGQKVLGLRLAKIAAGKALRGPRVASARFEGSGRRRIRIEFRDVNGRLVSRGRLAGFSVQVPEGGKDPGLFNTIVDGNTVLLLLGGEAPQGTTLWYGRGLDPYCNIVDEKNMALPVTGPVAIEGGS